MFGPNWSSSLEMPKLRAIGCTKTLTGKCVPSSVSFYDEQGGRYTYSLSKLDPDGADNEYKITGFAKGGLLTFTAGQGWDLHRDGKYYVYNENLAITKIVDENGAALNFSYTGSQLTQAVNTVGQSVQFVWGSNGRVSTVIDPNGASWLYEYNANGMLTKVTAPGTSPDIRSYHYENAQANLLTGISINNVRHSTYSYYTDGRVSKSALADGEEVDNLTYGTNFTTLTDARGQATTYSFTSVLGEMKLTGVSRAGTATCPMASAATEYDANGHISATQDWENNRTTYSYFADGKLNSTVATGPGAQGSVINTWNGLDITETEYRDGAGVGYLRVVYTYYDPGRVQSITRIDLKTGEQRVSNYAYTYFQNGALASTTITEPAANGGTATTTLVYDSWGNLTSATNPVGHMERWSDFDQTGRARRYVDANDVVTNSAYEPNGNLKTETLNLASGNRVTSYTYNNNRQPTSISYPNGEVVRFTYTSGGRQASWGDALGKYALTSVNAATRTVTQSAPRSVPTASGGTPVANATTDFVSTTVNDSLNRPYTTTGNGGQRLPPVPI